MAGMRSNQLYGAGLLLVWHACIAMHVGPGLNRISKVACDPANVWPWLSCGANEEPY